MKNVTRQMKNLLAVCSVSAWATSASAATYFFEDFEAQPITTPGTKIQNPPIGLPYFYNPVTSVETINIVTSPFPVIGTKSLETFRNETMGPDIIATSNDGALANGNILEIQWSHELANGIGHSGNAPMQNSIGYTNGLIGQLAFITINDTPGHNGEYHYSDAFAGYQIGTGLKATLSGWDRLRMVMTLQEFDPMFMTGTYDLFISLNGAPEVQAANDAVLLYAERATEASANGGLNSLWFRMQKGPFTSNSYYDNITIRDFAAVPTPVSWNVDSNGNWSLGTNWSPATAPNAAGAVASFGSIITAPRTVTLDAPQTVGAVNFDNANSYTISGTSTLTIDASSGNGALNVVSGSHTIAAPIVLADDTTVNVAAGQTLSVQHLRGAGVNVGSGTLRVIAGAAPNSTAGTTQVASLTIAAGAKLDVTNNSLIVDYTGAVWALVTDTRQQLLSNRLDSSSETTTRGLGYGDNAALSAVKTNFGGLSVDSSSILVKYTYFGDTDLDGDVDVADLGSLASAWQTSGVWTNGDFDYNGTVDVNDLGMLATNWQAGVGNPLGPSLAEALAAVGLPSAAVPEPTWMGVMGMGVVSMFARRCRRKHITGS